MGKSCTVGDRSEAYLKQKIERPRQDSPGWFQYSFHTRHMRLAGWGMVLQSWEQLEVEMLEELFKEWMDFYCWWWYMSDKAIAEQYKLVNIGNSAQIICGNEWGRYWRGFVGKGTTATSSTASHSVHARAMRSGHMQDRTIFQPHSITMRGCWLRIWCRSG